MSPRKPRAAAPKRVAFLAVNGARYHVEATPDTPLLWVLRDTLGLKGAKYGCGVGACGICTVLADGKPVRACVAPVAQVAGRAITTIEGLAADPMHPLLQAWIDEQVPQCGYCQPGQIMAAAALLAQRPSPTRADIDAAMSGVLCRSGTYQRIRRAIARAAPAPPRAPTAYPLAAAPRLVATVVRPPGLSGKPERIDARRALAVPGVRKVLEISSGVAVVAEHAASALAGRAALKLSWSAGRKRALSSAAIHKQLHQAVRRRGAPVRRRGDVERALGRAWLTLEAVYETPYLAHATLEPMNCIADVRANACDVWAPTQAQTAAQMTAAEIAGLPRKAVAVHTTFLGGGFGRRLETDFVADAVELSQRLATPVQVIWTRADDIQHDFYRPANIALLRGGLDEHRRPIAWSCRVAGPEAALDGIDMHYAIPNVREETVLADPRVPTGAWRSVGASQNAFAIESFVDELAHEAGEDPLAFRRRLLGHERRAAATLDLAAAKAGWGTPLSNGKGRGVALYRSFGSWVAEVAEVAVSAKGAIRIERVVAAIDCGIAVNPDAVRSQLEGAIAFGLSAALKERITIARGGVRERTFEDYPLLTMAEMPEVEVNIVASDAPPGGVGEPGVPPIAPAVANAVFAASGKRIRTLPFRSAR